MKAMCDFRLNRCFFLIHNFRSNITVSVRYNNNVLESALNENSTEGGDKRCPLNTDPGVDFPSVTWFAHKIYTGNRYDWRVEDILQGSQNC